MLHVCSHKNFVLELQIVKLHRKIILQQTPASDTPTSPHTQLINFFLLGMSVGSCNNNNWARQASPTLGCSIEISRDIYVGLYVLVCVGGITSPKNAHAQYWAVKNDLRHLCYSFLLYGYARAALAWTKKKPEKKTFT